MGLFDRLEELKTNQYVHGLFVEGDEFKEVVSAMLGNVPDATSSNAHNKEMEMFLYKLFGKVMLSNADITLGFSAGNLFEEFIKKGYPLAQELIVGGTNEDEVKKILTAQPLLDNPFATEEQKERAAERMDTGFRRFANDLEMVGSKATSRDALLGELEKRFPYNYVPELDPKYVSPELGQDVDKSLASFMNKLRQRSGEMVDGSPSPLAKKSLEVLEEFAENGYPSAQEQMGMIADEKNDKKAVNHWAKQLAKNPFATERQKEIARDDIKDTQAFVAQSQARGGL